MTPHQGSNCSFFPSNGVPQEHSASPRMLLREIRPLGGKISPAPVATNRVDHWKVLRGVLVGLDNFDYPSAEEDTTEQLTESLIVCLEKNTESLFFQSQRKKLS